MPARRRCCCSAKAGLPVANLREFIAYAEQHKAGMTYGSAGVGSISHYACVVLLSALKLNITHVPYRGVAPAMNDLMGGHIDFMCDQTTTALPQIAGGKIKALAVLSDQPLPQLPGVATRGEPGLRREPPLVERAVRAEGDAAARHWPA